MATDTLSIEDARRIALAAQGLSTALGRRVAFPAMVRRLGAVQLDTVSVLARSHELVAYRAPGGDRPGIRVEQAYWGPKSETFDTGPTPPRPAPRGLAALRVQAAGATGEGKAVALLEEKDKSVPGGAGAPARRGTADGRRLGGAKKGGPWWDWSETKIAADGCSTSASWSAPREAELRPCLRPG